MRRYITIVVGLIPVWAVLAILVVATTQDPAPPAPTTTTTFADTVIAKIAPTTTTNPELVLTTQATKDVEAALRLVQQLDPKRYTRMTQQPWEVDDCGGICQRERVLAFTVAEYTPCEVQLDTSMVRSMARKWRVPYLHLLAVTLVHEESHCHGTNERQALNTELAFERTWPEGQDRRAAETATRFGYHLLTKNGDWR